MTTECGRLLLAATFLTTFAAAALMLRACLRRGRDSFYPGVGAAAMVTLVILACCNTGVLGSAVEIVAGVTLGLALAQSRSRTVQ
jgi:hypothetical protein